jgi:hypothetical protein
VGKHLAASALLLSSIGCSGVRSVRGEVIHPAQIPVRSFPRIWVVLPVTPQERSLATALAHHLEGGDAEVDLVELRDLEPLRFAGRIPPATLVLLPRIEFRRGSETRWTSRPQTICGSSGCFRTRRSYQYEVPTLLAQATLTVYDGPTATVRQEARAQTSEEGRDWDVMENRSVGSLAHEIGQMLDQRVEIVDVELLKVEDEEVTRALSVIDDGDWPSGRRLLEASLDEHRLDAMPVEMRARALYDLGMARLYDRTTLDDPESHFGSAREALEAAYALDPEPRYRQATFEVEAHRQRFLAVQRQEAAREHNYRIGEGIPEPPAAYRESSADELSAPSPE